MTPDSTYVLDEGVVEVFSTRTNRERGDLLRIFKLLADAPNPPGTWVQQTPSGRNLKVKQFGKWLVTFWFDGPVNEVRIVDVKKVIP